MHTFFYSSVYSIIKGICLKIDWEKLNVPKSTNYSWKESKVIFLIPLLQIVWYHVRRTLELPQILFNLLALGLSYIKLFICSPFSSDICFGYYIQKLNYVRGFLFKNRSALPLLAHCHVNKEIFKGCTWGRKDLNPGWWILIKMFFPIAPKLLKFLSKSLF